MVALRPTVLHSQKFAYMSNEPDFTTFTTFYNILNIYNNFKCHNNPNNYSIYALNVEHFENVVNVVKCCNCKIRFIGYKSKFEMKVNDISLKWKFCITVLFPCIL